MSLLQKKGNYSSVFKFQGRDENMTWHCTRLEMEAIANIIPHLRHWGVKIFLQRRRGDKILNIFSQVLELCQKACYFTIKTKHWTGEPIEPTQPFPLEPKTDSGAITSNRKSHTRQLSILDLELFQDFLGKSNASFRNSLTPSSLFSVSRGQGQVPHVWRGRAAGRAAEVDSVLQRRDGHHLRGRVLLLQHGTDWESSLSVSSVCEDPGGR